MAPGNDGLDLLDVDVLAYVRKPGFHDSSTSRVREENTFKTLEMRLHFDSDV